MCSLLTSNTVVYQNVITSSLLTSNTIVCQNVIISSLLISNTVVCQICDNKFIIDLKYNSIANVARSSLLSEQTNHATTDAVR